MEVSILVTQKDYLSNEECTLADGKAFLEGDKLVYWEKNDNSVRNEVTVRDDWVIHRFSTYETLIRLEEGQGKAVVKSEMGLLKFDTKLLKYEKADDEYIVEYQLLANKEVLAHMLFKWSIKGVGYESN